MPRSANAFMSAFGLAAWLCLSAPVIGLASTALVRPLDTPAAANSGMFSLAASPDGDVFLSWIEPARDEAGDGAHALRVSRLDGERWAAPATVASGRDWFVNWADHPGLAALDARTLVAHWLVKSGQGAGVYGYGIRLARSADGGATWQRMGDIGVGASDDYSGFVTWMIERDRLRVAYLTPRGAGHAPARARGSDTTEQTGPATSAGARDTTPTASGAQTSSDTSAAAHQTHDGEAPKTLAIATITPRGIARDTALTLDDDTCQCCTTSSALTSSGAIIVYRDHLPGEIRDIAVVRETGSGNPRVRGSGDPGTRDPLLRASAHRPQAERSASSREGRRVWTEPAPVSRDGWVMPGCPTNGPVVAARDARVAVAWFTAANETPRVKLALSDDAGATFEAPIEVGADAPHGWPAIVMLDDGSAVVSWVEGTGADGDVRLRRVWRDGRMTTPQIVAKVRAGRSAGIPQMVRRGDSLIVAWRTDRVETALVTVPGGR